MKIPRADDAERAVLAAMLIDEHAIGIATDILRASDFFASPNQVTWEAICAVADSGRVPDVISVREHLQRQGRLDDAGGPNALLALTGEVISGASIESHASIVRDRAKQRSLLAISHAIREQAESNSCDPDATIEDAERRLFEASSTSRTGQARSVDDLLNSVFANLESVRSGGGVTGAIKTGYFGLDELTQGLRPGELVILAARPSMGKTSFALNVVSRAVLSGVPCAIFSLEMSAEQVMSNMLCATARVDGMSVRTGRMQQRELDQLTRAAEQLYENPSALWIDETPSISPTALRSKCRRLKQQHDIRMVVIDYLQLMSMGGKVESRQQEVSAISRSLKALARELGVPVIALSQLNRAVEQREDKKPRMSDLRESGAIEQDADAIFFLHREEYYNPSENNQGLAQVIIAKQRNGPTGEATLRFEKSCMRFENYTPAQNVAENIYG